MHAASPAILKLCESQTANWKNHVEVSPMQPFKLANILLDDTPQFLEAPTLLVRSAAPYRRAERGSSEWVFEGPGQHDFTTFFNGLSVQKWCEYTVAREFHLHLEVKGCAFTLVQTRADLFSWDTGVIEGSDQEVAASQDWHNVDVTLPAADGDLIEAFMLRIADEGSVHLRNAYYYTLVDPAQIRPVELALCTTTFKKESYIERNIRLVKDHILASDEPIATHFTQHVVDNGRTLDVAALEADRVHIHPNDNVGGSGGYARGMIAALEQTPKATHTLLMDDDVIIQPESIIRTYNLLSLVDDAHVNHFVSGAMMDLFEPDIRWEDTGFVTKEGDCLPLKMPAHIGLLHEVASNEVSSDHSELEGSEDQAQQYAGWWYCVIPVSQIEKNGLPLPIFVRFDDVEYALRCHARFMTMNGICLWHPSFNRRYSAAVERYQVVRNGFIASFTTGIAPQSNFTSKLYHTVQLELKKFNYTNADLALEGFEDFLKGPDYLLDPARIQQRFMDANRNAEKLVPFSELRAEAERAGIDLSHIQDADSQKATNVGENRTFPQRIWDFATFNGQRFALGYIKPGPAALIDVAGWLYPGNRIRRRDTIVAVDLENQKGVIRHLDKKRFDEVWGRYKRDMKTYKANEKRLREEYAAARERFTSVAFWKQYLKMDEGSATGDAAGAASAGPSADSDPSLAPKAE